MSELSIHICDRVIGRLKRYGFECTAADARTVHETGTHPDEALASAIVAELVQYGVL